MPPYFPYLAPANLFLFLVGILTKTSPISDGRGDRGKFYAGPLRHPTKHIPGRVPELEKRWEPCIKSGEEYFEGDKLV
jgi:hypothetical protein